MSIKRNAKTIGLVLLWLLAALLVALPVAAQSDDNQELVVVEGIFIITTDGIITVDDYVIAPANAFLPPDLLEGDAVLITGYLLPDGHTVQALTIEIDQDENETESDGTSPTSGNASTDTLPPGNGAGHGNGHGNGHGDDSGSGNGHGNDSGNGNGRGNGRGNGSGTTNEHGNGHGNGQGNGRGNGQGNGRGNGRGNDDNGSEQGFFCQNATSQHPAAARIAAEFDVPYAEVITLFCEGHRGFGQIVRAYRLSEASGLSVAEIFALRDAGQGWGRIIRDLGMNPGDIMGNGNGRGNGRGNGNG